MLSALKKIADECEAKSSRRMKVVARLTTHGVTIEAEQRDSGNSGAVVLSWKQLDTIRIEVIPAIVDDAMAMAA